jgi:hypothetical protein
LRQGDGDGEGGSEGGEEGKRDPREGGAAEGAVSATKKDQPPALGPLVLLACRHIYHQSCLETLLAKDGLGKETEYRCPIDG